MNIVIVSGCCEEDTYLKIDGNKYHYTCTKCSKSTYLKQIDYRLTTKKIKK